MSIRKTKRNKGQTTLEYFLVIGAIAVGMILAAKSVFKPGGLAQGLMEQSITTAQEAMIK